jgi:hypothetical protein
VFKYISPYSLIFEPKREAMKDIFEFVLTKSDKKSSMSCPSINTSGCRRDVILDGIVERRLFFCIFVYGIFFVFGSVYCFVCLQDLFLITENNSC